MMLFTEFAKDLLGLELTLGQRVVARVAFDGAEPGELEGEERRIALEVFGCEAVPPEARRILVLILGRESGKTTLGAAFALYTMLVADVSKCGPGDVPTVMAVAPDKSTAALSMRMALEMARNAPKISCLLESDTAGGFALRRPDGRLVAFEVFAASARGATTRGRTVLLLLMDESWFFHTGDTYSVNDRDVFNSVSARVRRAVFISTPWPVESLTHELFVSNFTHPRTALAARAPTVLMRDGGDADLRQRMEMERLRDPENAAREFDCDTNIGGSGMFFDAGALDASVDDTLPIEVPPPEAVRALTRTQEKMGMTPARRDLAAAVDVGFRRDASALAIVHRVGTRVMLMHIDEVRPKRGEPLKPSIVVDRFAESLQRYDVKRVGADAFYIESVRELLSKHKIGLIEAPSGQSGKAEQYVTARTIIHEGRFAMPRHHHLLAQMKSITSKPTPGGGLEIRAPRRTGTQGGTHGDLASALVLALWASDKGRESARGTIKFWPAV